MSAKILVIDHDPDDIEQLQRPLATAGYEVVVTTDVQAMATFERVRPDLMMIEAVLPERYGAELCRELKQTSLGKETPIVLVSSMPGDEGSNSSMVRRCGCDEMIRKPISAAEVVDTCKRLLESGPGAVVAEASDSMLDETEIQTALDQLESIIEDELGGLGEAVARAESENADEIEASPAAETTETDPEPNPELLLAEEDIATHLDGLFGDAEAPDEAPDVEATEASSEPIVEDTTDPEDAEEETEPDADAEASTEELTFAASPSLVDEEPPPVEERADVFDDAATREHDVVAEAADLPRIEAPLEDSPRRAKGPYVLAAVLTLIIVGGAVWWLWPGNSNGRQTTPEPTGAAGPDVVSGQVVSDATSLSSLIENAEVPTSSGSSVTETESVASPSFEPVEDPAAGPMPPAEPTISGATPPAEDGPGVESDSTVATASFSGVAARAEEVREEVQGATDGPRFVEVDAPPSRPAETVVESPAPSKSAEPVPAEPTPIAAVEEQPAAAPATDEEAIESSADAVESTEPVTPRIEEPVVVHRVEPTYPAKALKKSEGGEIALRVLVNEQGRIARVVVDHGPNDVLVMAAIDAVLSWEFHPGMEDGLPTKMWTRATFNVEPK